MRTDQCWSEYWWCLTSFPVLMQPLISLITPRLSILNRIIRVRGSKTCRRRNDQSIDDYWSSVYFFLILIFYFSFNSALRFRSALFWIKAHLLNCGSIWFVLHSVPVERAANQNISVMSHDMSCNIQVKSDVRVGVFLFLHRCHFVDHWVGVVQFVWKKNKCV